GSCRAMAKVADLPKPELGIPPGEAAERFDRLQKKLVRMWGSMREMTADERSIVVVPSQSTEFDIKGAEVQAYEERFLFLLLLLRQPRVRLIYVTSQTILPSTIDYYLGLLPGVIPRHARARLFLVAPEDRSPRPLSLKLLERPNLIEHIRSLIPDPENAHLVPYNTTELERDLALRLGIPMYATDPKFFHYGTKSGCRRLFAEEGVNHPLGVENLGSIEDVTDAIRQMRREKPGLGEVFVKLNEGISGEGNAAVALGGLPSPGSAGEAEAIGERVRDMRLEYDGATYENYVAKLAERGGIVEERISGLEFRSPSVQLRTTPLGELELLSTHDQILGGPTGQLYAGCRFPADAAYAAAITGEALKIGDRLAREGVLGRFAVDFVAVRKSDGAWDAYAIELNLRKGGTTHPFLTLQFLTDGAYDPEVGAFVAPSGRHKHFVASDHLESPYYRVFSPDDLFDIVVRHKLHFDQTRQTGVVFHMLATLAENGRIGVTAVGDSVEEANELFARTRAALDEEATAALELHRLPALEPGGEPGSMVASPDPPAARGRAQRRLG
ncbi:MAG: peptide ligase PGM1-related protein, partial [Alphaproteobacteria bacterium]